MLSIIRLDRQKRDVHALNHECVSLTCVNCDIMFTLVAAASEIKRVTIQLSLKDEQFSETLQDKTSEAHKTLKRTIVGAVCVVVQKGQSWGLQNKRLLSNIYEIGVS